MCILLPPLLACSRGDAVRDVQGLPVLMRVPRGTRAGREADLAHDHALFGFLGSCDEIDRSLITVAALTAMGKAEQLAFHLDHARRNGVTEDELKEAILHLTFYTGWPNGMSAMTVAKNVFTAEDV